MSDLPQGYGAYNFPFGFDCKGDGVNRARVAEVLPSFVPDGVWSQRCGVLYFSEDSDLVRFRLLV